MTSRSTSSTSSNPKPCVCTMCFDETLKLKVVGPCKHAFCLFCVASTVEDQEPGTGSFECPTCRLSCPLPAEGVEGLADDLSYSDSDLTDSGVGGVTDTDKSFEDNSFDGTECRICHHRGVKAEATNRCEDCDDLNLCFDCSRVHNKKFVGTGHVLSKLGAVTETVSESGLCTLHHERLKNYCHTCSQPCCHICVMLEHVEHETVKIGELLSNEINDLKKKIDEGKQRIRHLDQVRRDVIASKATILDWKQTMLRQIEARAEERLKEVIKQRDELKQKIKSGIDVAELSANILEIPEIQATLQSNIDKAEKLLSETAVHSIFLDRLTDVKEDLEIAIESEVEDTHWDILKQPLPAFIPSDLKVSIGEVSNASFSKATMIPGMTWFFKTKEDHVISSVANLGQDDYAIASPSSPVRRADSVEIRTKNSVKLIKENIYPAIDMTSTPGGQLAILTYGSIQGQGGIKLFDANKGYLKQIEGFSMDIPLSIATNIHGKFMVLDQEAQVGPRISCVDENGRVERARPVRNDQHGVRDITRISCGGRYIYIMGETGIAAYRYVNGKFEFKSSFTDHALLRGLDDIAATINDDVYVSYRQKTGKRREALVSRVLKNGTLTDWSFEPHIIKERVRKRTRMSVRNNTLVMSDGHHYAIYRLN